MNYTSAFKVIACALIFFPATLYAQEKPYQEPNGLNNWFVELGGAAYSYSVNYEKILFRSEHWGWTGRVGIGYNPTNLALLNQIYLDEKTFMIPFTSSALYGSREHKEKIELGGGFTLLAKGANDRQVAYTAVIGFRVIEMNKVFFRAAYTPIIGPDGSFTSWFGVSLGMNFSLKRSK